MAACRAQQLSLQTPVHSSIVRYCKILKYVLWIIYCISILQHLIRQWRGGGGDGMVRRGEDVTDSYATPGSKKIVVVGDGTVGKTALLHVYNGGTLSETQYIPTVFEVEEKEVKRAWLIISRPACACNCWQD